MTDSAWASGMAQLLALGLGGWPADPLEADIRSREMRRALDDLEDGAWLYACDQAAREQTWFPVPATLRNYAEGWRPIYPLLTPARDEATKERDREAAQRGVELIRQTLKARGIDVDAPVVKEIR